MGFDNNTWSIAAGMHLTSGSASALAGPDLSTQIQPQIIRMNAMRRER